jgi:hypothetical protein
MANFDMKTVNMDKKGNYDTDNNAGENKQFNFVFDKSKSS